MSDFYPLVDACEAYTNYGVKRTQAHWSEYIIRSIYSGFYLFFSLTFGAVAAGGPDHNALLFGIGFSIGLVFIVLTGAFLYTGDTASVGAAAVCRRISILETLRTWLLVYVFNVVGCLLAAALFGKASDIYHGDALDYLLYLGHKKSSLDWYYMFVRAIACNFLVCLATFLGTMAKSFLGKVVGIMLPISCFAAIGFEHCIANWIIIPLAKMLDTDQVTWGGMATNLAVVTIGNTIGGFCFMGLPTAYTLYLNGTARPALAEKQAPIELAPAEEVKE